MDRGQGGHSGGRVMELGRRGQSAGQVCAHLASFRMWMTDRGAFGKARACAACVVVSVAVRSGALGLEL